MKIVFSVLLSLFSIFLWVILHHFNLILSYPIVYWGFILLIIFRTLKEVYYFIKSHESLQIKSQVQNWT